jgi:hypothetical protein
LLDLKYLKESLHEDEQRSSQIARHDFKHIAKHDASGHHIGSHNGVHWFDLKTGEPFHAAE